MVTETTRPPAVSLPATCARVQLPRPPNYLQLADAEASIPVGKLDPDDALLLGLAMARNFMAHHRSRWEETERLSPREAEELPHPHLVHDAIVERIAERTCEGWRRESPDFQRARREGIAATLRAFLEEMARA